MKYTITDIIIPQDRRKEINEKCLYVIENKLDALTPEIIFSVYSGKGGLHGLEYKEFDSYHSFSESKKQIEQGAFFTPAIISKFMVDCIKPNKSDLVSDMTCGAGSFFNYLPVEHNIYGNEIDISNYKVCKYLYPNANLQNEDIRNYNPDVKFDIILGNPPFGLNFKVGKDEHLSQLYYCLKASELLNPAGFMVLIVPKSFLADSFSDSGMIKTINKHFNFICQFDLPTNAFKSTGVENFATKIMFFQKQSEHLEVRPYSTDKIQNISITDSHAEFIYNQYLLPYITKKESIKSKLFLENIHNSDSLENAEYQYKVKKMLFAIKQHPVINSYYGKCLDYINKFNTQKMPEGMKYEEWSKVKITEKKVLSYLKKTLAKQSKNEHDEIRLVKTQYGLKLKGYSQKNKIFLSKYNGIKTVSINDLIISGEYPFEDQTYKLLLDSKIKSFKQQNTKLKELPLDLNISRFLNNISIYDNDNKETIKLNDMQKEDLNRVLQKQYSILNWQQGSGKTLGGIVWYKYLLSQNKVRNIFIVSAALGINLTWDVKLKDYGENYIKIKSLTDINNIQPGQVVIMSFNMLIKYQRQIKKFIKMQSKKVALIVDESDELTNESSLRTKTTLKCFRKANYKLLTTGTTTRNNINELYSQLELLYNNSINMLCKAEYIYKFNKEKELEEERNPYYMKPFPAYHGKILFKSSFSPHKVTVFGVKKDNQDIYNVDKLQDIIEKTIITRKFKEIVGRKIYEIKTHRIKQNESEKEVYKVIMEEFYQMLYLFRSTGNSRKDSMLRIIRQIQLLIKATSTPHQFKEYKGSKLPNKYHKIFNLIEQWSYEKVAIGTVFLDTAEDYYLKLNRMFPDRQIFLIKGDISFNKRKSILDEFEETENGILVSTQQSLKSSVNIPTCDKVIIESMQWNIPKISQYYFRFIRFNSKQNKEVHFITYDHTIEQNLLALLLSKERINEYIKTLDFKDQEDIYNEFDVDLSILDSIIEKETDDEGHTKLTLSWGKQKIV